MELRVTPPANITGGDFSFTVLAQGTASTAEFPIELTVREKVPASLTFETEFPTLRGGSDSSFNFNTTLKNHGDDDISVILIAEAPRELAVTFKASGKDITKLPTDIKSGSSQRIDITAEPLTALPVGSYPITVIAQGEDAETTLNLTAEVTGQPQLNITTPDGRLSAARVLFAKRNELAEQVRLIEQNEDVAALATDAEKSLLKKLPSVKSNLADMSGNPDITEQQEKYRLLNGVLNWKLETDFPIHMWQTRKEMIALNNTSEQFNQTVNILSEIFTTRPVQDADFLNRIRTHEAGLKQIRKDISSSVKTQEELIAKMALTAANQYQTRIEAYLDRALYSRARLYDALTIPRANPQAEKQ